MRELVPGPTIAQSLGDGIPMFMRLGLDNQELRPSQSLLGPGYHFTFVTLDIYFH